jgi:hypothetical protein
MMLLSPPCAGAARAAPAACARRHSCAATRPLPAWRRQPLPARPRGTVAGPRPAPRRGVVAEASARAAARAPPPPEAPAPVVCADFLVRAPHARLRASPPRHTGLGAVAWAARA